MCIKLLIGIHTNLITQTETAVTQEQRSNQLISAGISIACTRKAGPGCVTQRSWQAAILILAAGQSSQFRFQKQASFFDGVTAVHEPWAWPA